MPSEELNLFDLMDYYPEQAAKKKRKEEALKPIKTHKSDRLDYPAAIAEIERILGKKLLQFADFIITLSTKKSGGYSI